MGIQVNLENTHAHMCVFKQQEDVLLLTVLHITSCDEASGQIPGLQGYRKTEERRGGSS